MGATGVWLSEGAYTERRATRQPSGRRQSTSWWVTLRQLPSARTPRLCVMLGMAALAGAFRRPFYRYWLSEFLAAFGSGVRLAAFPLLAAQLTRAPAAVAAVTAVTACRGCCLAAA
jgi:hypothetical protein